MSAPRLIYPMLDGFLLGDEISSHDGVRCYPALQRKTEEKYILKIISLPASPVQVEALLITGAVSSRETALTYFHKQAEELAHQAHILHRLSHQEGFIPYADCQIISKEDGFGYEVYLLGSYKHSAEKILRAQQLTQLGAIQMGLDLCAALSACRRAGYLYMDLQPANVYYTEEQGYRIGDLGFAALDTLQFTSLPQKYRSSYTAPEMRDDFAVLNSTLDVYALGLMLYQAYNGGQKAEESEDSARNLLPPLYADYEMAEIILKACDPNPANRWQDPTQLAQALVEYMQRNEIGDEPIIPPVEKEPEEEPEEFLPEADPAELQQEMDALEAEDDLVFLNEISPEEAALTHDSREESPTQLAQMLEQADSLIAHPLPEPPVAPQGMPIAMPEPLEPEVQELPEPEVSEPPQEAVSEDISDADQPQIPEDPVSLQEPAEEIQHSGEPEELQANRRSFRFPKRLFVILAVLAVLAAGIYGGYYYYNEVYIQTIDDLILHNQDDSVTVQIITDIEDELLTVECSDSYGNIQQKPVTAGVAIFTDLDPQTRYTIRVTIAGTHKLTGKTTQSFSTAARTHILSFSAGIGTQDGSVILDLTSTGPEVTQWLVTCHAPGESERSVPFSGNSVQITGLTIGKTYTFSLAAADGRELSGTTSVDFLATEILLAQSLSITECGNGALRVQWQQPEGYHVESWTLHCYNASGYDQTVTTTELQYTFTGLTHDVPCTVDITALGMHQSVSITVEANPVMITSYHCTADDMGNLVLSWEFTGNAPQSGWQVQVVCNGLTQQLSTLQPQVSFAYLPDMTYSILILTGEGSEVFGNTYSFTTGTVEHFTGHGIQFMDIAPALCVMPEPPVQLPEEIPQEFYKTAFSEGEQPALVLLCTAQADSEAQPIGITYVLRSLESILQIQQVQADWSTLWHNGSCLLPLALTLPEPGEYMLEIYFNGQYVGSEMLTVE